jgi:hypothetical protein
MWSSVNEGIEEAIQRRRRVDQSGRRQEGGDLVDHRPEVGGGGSGEAREGLLGGEDPGPAGQGRVLLD